MSNLDWGQSVIIDAYSECNNVGPSMEDLYQAFKSRLIEDIMVIRPELIANDVVTGKHDVGLLEDREGQGIESFLN